MGERRWVKGVRGKKEANRPLMTLRVSSWAALYRYPQSFIFLTLILVPLSPDTNMLKASTILRSLLKIYHVLSDYNHFLFFCQPDEKSGQPLQCLVSQHLSTTATIVIWFQCIQWKLVFLKVTYHNCLYDKTTVFFQSLILVKQRTTTSSSKRQSLPLS